MPDSPNTGAVHVEANQNQKTVSINDALDRISNFVTENLAITITGNRSLTDNEFQTNTRFDLAGTPGVAFNLDVPANIKKLFVVNNQTDTTATVQVTGGAGTNVAIASGDQFLVYSDGTDVSAAGGGGADRLVAVSANDSTPGNLLAKLAAGTNITFTEQNDAGNETLLIDAAGGGASAGVSAFVPVKEARVERSTAQSISDGVSTLIQWDTEETDTDGFVDLGTSNTRITIPAGINKVILRANIDWAGSSAGDRQHAIKKNGSFVAISKQRASADGTSSSIGQVHTDVIDVTAGDYFELEVQQDSGGALNVDATTAANATWFTLQVIDPAPQNFVVGTDYTVPFRGAELQKTGVQSIANTTTVTLTWDSEIEDTDEFHDNVTNNSRITIPSGITRVSFTAFVEFAASATGDRIVSIAKNGTTLFSHSSDAPGSGTGRHMIHTGAMSVAAGDYFEIEVFQNSGGALDVQATDNTFFKCQVLETEAAGVREITGTTGTIEASDNGGVIRTTSGTAVTLTASDNLPQGFHCAVYQDGAGQITFAAEGTATLSNRQGHTKSAGEHAALGLAVMNNSDGASANIILAGDTVA